MDVDGALRLAIRCLDFGVVHDPYLTYLLRDNLGAWISSLCMKSWNNSYHDVNQFYSLACGN